MLDLLLYFGWNYISFLYSDDSYGRNAAALLEAQVQQRGICLAVEYCLSAADNVASLTTLIERMMSNEHSNVVVLFAQTATTTPLFKVLNTMNITSRFLFLSGDYYPTYDYPQVIEGIDYIEHIDFINFNDTIYVI